ncbi:hypothetical protein IMSAGC015_00818 [Lachnospiraceae bacterium]|nr:hypothetical protein [Dorea sp.]GFI36648.1 hypothetical protein IMSAGC015_00818 [Lachnospiraceae bacterium]
MGTFRGCGSRIDCEIRGANTLRKAKLFEVLCEPDRLLSKQKVDRLNG